MTKEALLWLVFGGFFIAPMMVAMAVGVIVSGKRLRGSCGGPGNDCWCKIDKAQKERAAKRHLPMLGQS